MTVRSDVAAGDEVRLIEQHAGIAKSVALRAIAELGLDRALDEDLIAYGQHGLLEAVRSFDPARGVRFAAYAHYRVRWAVLDGVRRMARLPVHVHAIRRAAEAADWQLEEAGALRASSPEMSEPETAAAQMHELLSKIAASVVIASVGFGDERAPATPEAVYAKESDKERVRRAMEVLPARELLVVRAIYFDDRSLDDIGAELGISKSWVSRIHTRALGLLRDELEERASAPL